VLGITLTRQVNLKSTRILHDHLRMTTLDIPVAQFDGARTSSLSVESRQRTISAPSKQLNMADERGDSTVDLIQSTITRIDAKSMDAYRRHFAEECAISSDGHEEPLTHKRLKSDGSALSFVVPVLDDISEDLDTQSIVEKTGVPMEELLAVYGCSWDHDGLPRAGRLFVTPQHVCFYAKSLGRKDKFVVNWKDVKQLEKKMTAGFVPNGLRIVTTSNRYNMSNVGKRDQVYAKLVDLWTIASGPLQRDPRPLQVGEHQFVQLPRVNSIDSLDSPIVSGLLAPTPPPITPSNSLPSITITQESWQRLPGSFDHNLQSNPLTMTDAVLTAADSVLRYTGVSSWIPQRLKDIAREAASRVQEPSPSNKQSDIDSANGLKNDTNVVSTPTKSPELLTPKVSSRRPDSIKAAPLAIAPQHLKTTSYSSASSESPISMSPELYPASVCGCSEHYKHDVINEVFSGTLDQVVQAWFAEGGSTAFRDTHDRIETTELKCGPWDLDTQGGWTKRTVEFMSTFKPPMLPKQSTPATEVQEVIRRSNMYVSIPIMANKLQSLRHQHDYKNATSAVWRHIHSVESLLHHIGRTNLDPVPSNVKSRL